MVTRLPPLCAARDRGRRIMAAPRRTLEEARAAREAELEELHEQLAEPLEVADTDAAADELLTAGRARGA